VTKLLAHNANDAAT